MYINLVLWKLFFLCRYFTRYQSLRILIFWNSLRTAKGLLQEHHRQVFNFSFWVSTDFPILIFYSLQNISVVFSVFFFILWLPIDILILKLLVLVFLFANFWFLFFFSSSFSHIFFSVALFFPSHFFSYILPLRS